MHDREPARRRLDAGGLARVMASRRTKSAIVQIFVIVPVPGGKTPRRHGAIAANSDVDQGASLVSCRALASAPARPLCRRGPSALIQKWILVAAEGRSTARIQTLPERVVVAITRVRQRAPGIAVFSRAVILRIGGGAQHESNCSCCEAHSYPLPFRQ